MRCLGVNALAGVQVPISRFCEVIELILCPWLCHRGDSDYFPPRRSW